METKHHESHGSHPKGGKSDRVNFSFQKPKLRTVGVGAALLFVVMAVFFGRSILVAATVNGSPISRLSVIRELEKEGGKQVLESLISKKIIETELGKRDIKVLKEEVDAEVAKINEQIELQGGTFTEALATQGLTEEKLREQIRDQKRLETILADKVAVSDAEIDTHIKESKEAPAMGVSAENFKAQIREELKREKFQKEAQKWVADLTASAKVQYYVAYE